LGCDSKETKKRTGNGAILLELLKIKRYP